MLIPTKLGGNHGGKSNLSGQRVPRKEGGKLVQQRGGTNEDYLENNNQRC